MPYTSKTVTAPASARFTKYTNFPTTSVSTEVSTANPAFVVRTMSWSRSGTDRNASIRKQFFETAGIGYELVKKPTKYWYKQRYLDHSGKRPKWRTRRTQIMSYRLVKKRKKLSKGTYGLTPNDLNYWKEELQFDDSGTTGLFGMSTQWNTSYSDGQVYYRIRGDHLAYDGNYTWPLGLGGPYTPNPDSYTASGISAESAVLAAETELKNHVVGILMSQRKDQSVNLQNAIAEGRKTINSIAQAASRIAETLLLLKSGKIARAMGKLFPQSPKQFANDYLLYQYGIKPLIGDINGAAKHLAYRGSKILKLRTKRSLKLPLQTTTMSIGGNVKVKSYVFIETEVTVRGVLELEVTDEVTAEASQLGFTNPLETAWELVPFSFVADWFIPIGSYLNKLDSHVGTTVRNYHTTTVVKRTVRCVNLWGGFAGGTSGKAWLWANGETSWEKKLISVKRTKSSFPSYPPLPSLKNPLSAQHLSNATALFTQLLNKGKSK